METKIYTCNGCGRVACDWKNNTEESCPKCEPAQQLKDNRRYLSVSDIRKILEKYREQAIALRIDADELFVNLQEELTK